jgi:predicted NUDIX family NTP pyrophosphohydrolase
MTKKQSAGLLLYRFKNKKLQVLLVHPGGPFWKNKDTGAWSIPKGEFTEEEDALAAARREVQEELGQSFNGKFTALEPVKLKTGKIVYAWALEADFDPEKLVSNEFEMEWPPRSGKKIMIPEVDQAAWFSPEEAREKINPAQVNLIDQLELILENKVKI